ncbi:hypothetical protein H0H92_004598 [Tricholoma furcatifolium]|nr:hypothetical protein H0H92_004598 [Tricholoma furcatifolium]
MSLNATYRDSSALRASVFDVCLQLGALDENSLVADWMFNDSSESASNGENTSTRQAPSRPTRFTETFSPVEVAHDPPRRRFLPFSLKAVTFPTHFCRRSKSNPKADNGPRRRLCKPKKFENATGSGRWSLALRQGMKFTDTSGNSERTTNVQRRSSLRTPPVRPSTLYDDGRVSTHPQSFFQLKLPSRTVSHSSETRRSEIHSRSAIPFDTPIYSEFANPDRFDQPRILPEDDDDAEWEEVEAPDSPICRLPNKGMNPSSPIKQRKSRPESSDTMDDDDDTGVIVHDASHNTFTFSLPRVVFQRPSRQARLSGSSGPSSRRLSKSSVKRNSTPLYTMPRRQSTSEVQHVRNLSRSLPSSPTILSETSPEAPSSNTRHRHQSFVQTQGSGIQVISSIQENMND